MDKGVGIFNSSKKFYPKPPSKRALELTARNAARPPSRPPPPGMKYRHTKSGGHELVAIPPSLYFTSPSRNDTIVIP